MLTLQELLNEIERRPLSERVIMLETLANSFKAEFAPANLPTTRQPLASLTLAERLERIPPTSAMRGIARGEGTAPTEGSLDVEQYQKLTAQLGLKAELPASFGMLNPTGYQYSDAELDNIKYEYFREKYQL